MKRSHAVDAYIEGFPHEVQKVLECVRSTIRKAAPDAEEVMKYGIPTYVLHGNLVHFGGFKKHIGFFPAPSGIVAFKKELSPYKTSKGAVQFPLSDKVPHTLIRKITTFRVAENMKKKVSAKKGV